MGDLTPSMINPLATPLPLPFIRSVVMNLYYKICISRVGGAEPPKLFANMQQPADRSTVHFDARPLDF